MYSFFGVMVPIAFLVCVGCVALMGAFLVLYTKKFTKILDDINIAEANITSKIIDMDIDPKAKTELAMFVHNEMNRAENSYKKPF